jgi:hypothetical protein
MFHSDLELIELIAISMNECRRQREQSGSDIVVIKKSQLYNALELFLQLRPTVGTEASTWSARKTTQGRHILTTMDIAFYAL